MASLRSGTKMAGSGSGSIGKRYGSADQNPYQYFTDLQHWKQARKKKYVGNFTADM